MHLCIIFSKSIYNKLGESEEKIKRHNDKFVAEIVSNSVRLML